VDWEKIDTPAELLEYSDEKDNIDVCFTCLGTTRKDAGSAEAFKRVDYGYVSKIIDACKAKSVPHYYQVSATNANASSYFLYPQTKGRIDAYAVDAQLPFTTIVRPGLLEREDKARFVEKLGSWFVNAMPVQNVARVMVKHFESVKSKSNSESASPTYWYDADINRIARM